MSEEGPFPARREASSSRAAMMSVGLGVLFAVAYVLARRDTSHEYDIYWMLPLLRSGQLDYPRHPLAFHIAHSLASWLEIFGGSLHERLKVACGLSTGLAVAIFAQAAYLLRRDRCYAVTVAVTFACLPATVYFATVMELHALFLPFAAAAMCMGCRLAAAPAHTGVAPVLTLGVLTALASAVHATGHLLVLFFAVWLALEWRAAGQAVAVMLRSLACLAIAHALCNGLVRLAVLPQQSTAPALEQIDWLTQKHLSLHDVHRTFTWEWLLPFVPVSLLWLLAFAGPARRLAFALLLSLLAYVAACQLLLVLPDGGYSFFEFGAYQLPMAFVATLLTVDRLRSRGRILLLLVTLAAGAYGWIQVRKPPANHAFGRVALDYLQQHDERLVVGGFDEFDGIFDLAEPTVWATLAPRVINTSQLILHCRQSGASEATQIAIFLHPSVAGKVSVLTEAALARLRGEGGMFAELVEHALPTAFRLEPVEIVQVDGGTLRGVRLTPR